MAKRTEHEVQVSTIDQFFDGSRRHELSPPAPMATGLTAKRLGLGYRLAKIFNSYAKEALEEAQDVCNFANCEMRLLSGTDDGGNTSTAIYHCPKGDLEPRCLDRATNAASKVIFLTDRDVTAIGRTIDTIEDHLPAEVHVSILQSETSIPS